METTFRIKTSELDKRFLDTIKALFKKREIEITVTDVIQDETTFLLKDPANKNHLLQAIDEVEKNKNLVRFTGAEFKKFSSGLLIKK